VYRWGHVGAALFCYAPVAGALRAVDEPALALLGIAVAVACATLPDADELDALGVAHRGPTHTVWFVGLGAGGAGLVGAVVSLAVGFVADLGMPTPGTLAVVVGSAAAVSLASHLLADSLTPMGVRPFAPLSGWHHSFDLTPAKSPRANVAMLVIGVLCVLVSLGFSPP
jgi:inner membrane protein